MNDSMFDVVIVAGGESSRAGIDKLSYNLGRKSVLDRTLECFDGIENISQIIVVGGNPSADNIVKAIGGQTRTDSVKCGLEKVTAPYCLIHDGARPFVSKALIKKVMSGTILHNSCVPCIATPDSLRRLENGLIVESLDRRNAVRVQTPQGFASHLIKEAFRLSKNEVFTDESEVFGEYILPPYSIDGEISNRKITYYEDLLNLNCHLGSGFDTHMFTPNRKLILGGVEVPYEYGLKAHSDGDVVLHSVMDAILSANGKRDIGIQFPDNDIKYKNISSTKLLRQVTEIISDTNRKLVSLTITIMAQKPKLSGYIPKMRSNIAEILSVDENAVAINATTTENLGITKENSGIAVLSLAAYT